MFSLSHLPPLPIDEVLPHLQEVLKIGSKAVLIAEPGAGKTTRAPLALLDEPWRTGKIIVLVPRRAAARAAAMQMSRLLGQDAGQTVGYRIRMDSRVSSETLIELVTEGVFTRMIIEDPWLNSISAVVFDEFHERSMEGDLALALALDVQSALRPELRLLIMSATLDAAKVGELMGNAPQILSKGRSFPVETRYLPAGQDERIEDAVSAAVLKALDEQTGSILAFLPGAGEIRRVEERLRDRVASNIVIAPLYGALELAAQQQAIAPAPAGKRKVVLASAVAETSLTIEGVRVVIDSGLSRVPKYNPGSGLTRLETVRVSQASAEQRRGRAGRLEPGTCYRLWAEGQTRAFQPYNRPEILEADLAPLVLTCAALGITSPETLKFLDPPPAAALTEARQLLQRLEAIDKDNKITETGKAILARPLPPRLAHMLLKAEEHGQGEKAARLAVLLTERGIGGNSPDIGHRLQHLQNDRSQRTRQAIIMAEYWTRPKQGPQIPMTIGEILALAFPDRIALARLGKSGEFVLASGKGVYVDKTENLSREQCLVVAEAQGTETRSRILLAAAYDKHIIEKQFPHLVVQEEDYFFDAAARKVRATNLTKFGTLVLREQRMEPQGMKAQQALVEGIRTTGLVNILTDEARQTLARMTFLRAHNEAAWPVFDFQLLQETLKDWLMPYLPNAISLHDITPQIQRQALEALLTQEQQRKLRQEAPPSFQAPTGQTFPIDYTREGGPTVSIRVQQLFGLSRHPYLAGGQVPLTFELLSPAHRPIQLTKDLPKFWQGSWAEARRELRGRYPKHDWPEDPISAKPTARAKPRN